MCLFGKIKASWIARKNWNNAVKAPLGKRINIRDNGGMHRLRVIFPHYAVNHRAEIERKAKQTFGVPANCMIKCNLLFAINFSTWGCKHFVSCVYAYVRFKRVLSLPAVGVWNSLSAWHILDVYVNMQVQVVGYADLWVCFFLGDTINPRNNETYSPGFTFFVCYCCCFHCCCCCFLASTWFWFYLLGNARA